MIAIEICEENLELIAVLNDGIRPLVTVPHEYFVYTDSSTPVDIISNTDWLRVKLATEPDILKTGVYWAF